MTVAPWQIWEVDFDPQVGSEQASRRPAIVVGSSVLCDTAGRNLALVVPCTTRDRGLAWQPKIMLHKPSVVLCEQVKAVPRQRLVRRWNVQVPPEVRDEIRWNLHNFIA